MPILHKLTATQVRNTKVGKYNDGAGLWFQKRADGGGQWFLRVTVHGRRREMGLGSSTAVSLKEARELADKWRAVTRGTDRFGGYTSRRAPHSPCWCTFGPRGYHPVRAGRDFRFSRIPARAARRLLNSLDWQEVGEETKEPEATGLQRAEFRYAGVYEAPQV